MGFATPLSHTFGQGFWRVEMRYGFMDGPDMPTALEQCSQKGLTIDPRGISCFHSCEIVVPTPGSGITHWRELLFASMSRNAGSVADVFKLPQNCVVELGTRVQI